jgi:hypothetical protein
MADHVEALTMEPVAQRTMVPGAPRGGWVELLVLKGPRMAVVASKESQNGGGGVKEVPARGRRRGPDDGNVRGK